MPVLKYRPDESSSWQTVGTTVDGYSKEETDALLQNKADTSSVYTKTEADTLLQNKANTADFQSHTANKSNPHGVTATQTGAYTKGETDTLLANKADKDCVINPNLLDNWYFGNLVDQRGGYVVPPGKPYLEGSTQVGTTDKYYTATPFSTWYNITVNGVVYNVASSDVVRGYTGAGYGIDRWRQQTDGAVLINQDGLQFNGRSYVATYLDFDALSYLRGKQVTLSVLYKNALSGKTVATDWYGNEQKNLLLTSGSEGLAQATFTIPSDATEFRYIIGANTPEQTKEWYTIQAIKLELGYQQTLAHQDANGNWVLNEIPDYGEQLTKCLRHDYIIGRADYAAPIGLGTAYDDTSVVAVIDLPEMMRANPAVSITGVINLRFSASQNIVSNSVFNYGFSGDKVQLYFSGLSGLTQGQSCDIYVSQGSKMEFNANL